MDFVWNESQGEAVRSASEQALTDQADELRGAAERFNSHADNMETQVGTLQMQITLLTMKLSNPKAAAQFDPSVIDSLHQQISQLLEQIPQIRSVADGFTDAAETLESGIKQTNQRYDNMHSEAKEIDNNHAYKAEGAGSHIDQFIKNMEDLYNSFGGTIPEPSVVDGPGKTPEMENTLKLLTAMLTKLAGNNPTCAYNGDPINMSTGNFIYSKTDLEIPGRYPISFTRFYNALGSSISTLGANWTHNFNIILRHINDQVLISFADGHVETYDNVGDDTFLSPLDAKKHLANVDGNWILTAYDMEVHHFDSTGKLQAITDPNGNATHFAYTDDLLTQVSTQSGSMSFSYDQSNHITAITDHIGRTVSLEYEKSQLTKVTNPDGATRQYAYDNNGFIQEVTNPLGITTVKNTYDSTGRTIKQDLPDGGVMEYIYNDSNNTTTYVQQNGIPIVYKRDDNYRTTQIQYVGGTYEAFGYDNRNNRTYHIDRNKNKYSYEYDLLNNPTKVTDPLGNSIFTEYNSFNKPTVITTPTGGKITSTYDNRGNLTAISDPLNRKVAFALDANGKTTVITLPDASVNHIEYDTRGNITAITNSMCATTRYTYDTLNRVGQTTDPSGATTSYTYNKKGDITTATDAMGNTTRYKYNKNGKVVKITDPGGGEVSYTYNAVGKVETITDPQGGKTTLTYDKVWNITAVTDPMGNTVHYQYDADNRITKTTDQEGNEAAYRHDPNGNVVSVINPLGAETIILYDALNRQKQVIEPGNATTSMEYDPLSNITKVTDPLGNTTTYKYDIANQLTQVTDPMGNKTTITYTALGKAHQITNAAGTTTYSYYPGGLLKSVSLPGTGEVETYQYDPCGNIIAVTDALGNTTTMTYDSLNRITKTTNALNNSKHYAYDVRGNITAITDENGHTTRYKYSPLGDVIEVTDPTGHSTHYNYDALQQLTELKQYNSLGEPQITTYQYDKTGNVIQSTSPLGDMVRYGYDRAGNLISKVDEDSHETLYTYNLTSQLTKVAYADGKTVELTYNPLKQLTQMKDWLGTTSIEVDPLGRATKVTDHNNNEISYTYNPQGQRESIIYPGGNEVRYQYTPQGYLHKVVAGEDTTTYTHDPLGRITQRILPDSTVTKYEFNPLGALETLIHSRDNAILDKFQYTYDPSGNMTKIDKHRAGIDSDNGVFSYTYDPLNRLTEAIKGDGTSKQYHYDPIGNRISSIQSGIETRHIFNARNQLIQTTEGSDTTNYTYDKRGNLTQTTVNGQLQHRYTFDATNMMTAAHNPQKGDATYTYNGFRSRVAKLENMASTSYVLDMTRPYDNLLATQGTQNQSFIWGSGLLSATGEAKEGNFHYLQDHLGSPIRLLHENPIGGNLQPVGVGTALAYDEFGVPEVAGGQQHAHNPFGFTGYQTDDVSGAYYAQARFYNPNIGRFTAEDFMKDRLNWYGYCDGNPVNLIDPTGLVCEANNTPSNTIIEFGRDIGESALTGLWDFTRGTASGFGDIGTGLWNELSDPMGILRDTGDLLTHIVMNPHHVLRDIFWAPQQIIDAAQAEGAYGLGRTLGPSLVIVICTKGLGAKTKTATATTSPATAATNRVPAPNTWANPNGTTRWPLNDGFARTPTTQILQPGMRVDRFGSPSGRFVAPVGTPAAQRSLAPGTSTQLSVYEVVRPVQVQAGTAAPWFGQPGGGIQFRFDVPTGRLADQGILRRIN